MVGASFSEWISILILQHLGVFRKEITVWYFCECWQKRSTVQNGTKREKKCQWNVLLITSKWRAQKWLATHNTHSAIVIESIYIQSEWQKQNKPIKITTTKRASRFSILIKYIKVFMIYYYYFDTQSQFRIQYTCVRVKSSRVELYGNTWNQSLLYEYPLSMCSLLFCAMRRERLVERSERVSEWNWVRTQSLRFEVCRASNRAVFWFLFSIFVAISIQYESRSLLYKARKIRSRITLRSHVIMDVWTLSVYI